MLWLEQNNARDVSQREGRAPGWDFSPSLPSRSPAVPHAAVRIISCGGSEVSWRECSFRCCLCFLKQRRATPKRDVVSLGSRCCARVVLVRVGQLASWC